MDEGGDVKSRGWEEPDAKGYGRVRVATTTDKAEPTTGATLTLVSALETSPADTEVQGVNLRITDTTSLKVVFALLESGSDLGDDLYRLFFRRMNNIATKLEKTGEAIVAEKAKWSEETDSDTKGEVANKIQELQTQLQDTKSDLMTLTSALAHNPHLPKDVVDKFLKHEDQFVRLATLKVHGAKFDVNGFSQLISAERAIVMANLQRINATTNKGAPSESNQQAIQYAHSTLRMIADINGRFAQQTTEAQI